MKQQFLVKKYYGDIFSNENERVLIFDCGYGGSVSRGIGKAINNRLYIDKLYMWQNRENIKSDYLNETKTFEILPRIVKNNDDLLMELLLSECVGSYIGLKDNLDPICDELSQEKQKSNIEVLNIQEIALNCIRDFCCIFENRLHFFKIKDNCCLSNLVFELVHSKGYKKSGILKKIIFEEGSSQKKEHTVADILFCRNLTFLQRVSQHLKKILRSYSNQKIFHAND